ncbi:Crp/Fnr family transcriptional regulator [uncultured Mucilaginibacter sp.]|uniref:Crp/Fnr family transcriptional regulator n=1 Tax=uncultured Mucilaginibacter sp. TaxID=797541 RepID=UPI0025E9A6FF|nr:Crp/Fnr family transcriptional regulator [uncultured Mucilaginibacter sp.]
MDTQVANEIFRVGMARFITFTDDEWQLCSQNIGYLTLKKKENFTVPERVEDRLGFIVSGSVRYFYIKDGEEVTGYFCFEKEFVSSYKSFLRIEPGINYIQALEDTEMIVVTRQQWEQLLAHPQLAYKMERFGRLLAEHYLCCYEDRIAAFVTESPEERYLKLLSNGKGVLQRIPQHYIAHYLGITHVSLSRIRKRIFADRPVV